MTIGLVVLGHHYQRTAFPRISKVQFKELVGYGTRTRVPNQGTRYPWAVFCWCTQFGGDGKGVAQQGEGLVSSDAHVGHTVAVASASRSKRRSPPSGVLPPLLVAFAT
eukprot:3907434-Rhodomonas_salina.1